ncbi:MAG: hypothetical protein GJ680_06960 [Alteromonadaceae bacterium]|nr:hypothetical protein [Alteromonadaceae bacterium]
MKITAMKLVLLVVSLALVNGCTSTTKKTAQFDPVQFDKTFPDYQQETIIEPTSIFKLEGEVLKDVRNRIKYIASSQDKARALVENLLSPERLKIDYEYGANTIAEDTYLKGEANCLSLTILAYSIAKEARLNVKFQEVFESESWNQEGQFDIINGHVNLLVSQPKNRLTPVGQMQQQRLIYTVDFFPSNQTKGAKTEVISKDQIIAYFYGNIGARALIAGDVNKAYANFRQALLFSPNDSGSWNNLGHLLTRVNAYELAELSYQNAIDVQPNNHSAWENLAKLYGKTDRLDEKLQIQDKLKRIRQNNPNYYLRIANRHLLQNELGDAISAYKQSIKLAPDNHFSHFGLAKAYGLLGDRKKVKFYLAKAKRVSEEREWRNRYQTKLEALARGEYSRAPSHTGI